MRSRSEVVTLIVLTAMFALLLMLIRDVDRPFGGAIGISSTAMQETEVDIAEDFSDAYGEGKLPCDEKGDARD